jgi:hypothetical protein
MTNDVRRMRQSGEEFLRKNIRNHLHIYRDGGDFGKVLPEFNRDTELVTLADGSVGDDKIDEAIAKIQELSGIEKGDTDSEDADLFYDSFSFLTPLQAVDPRLWVYMAHFPGLDYTLSRYPIPNGDQEAVDWIGSHFFCDGHGTFTADGEQLVKSGRGAERALRQDSAFSRLWWMGHIANQIENMDRMEALKLIVRTQETWSAIHGRS